MYHATGVATSNDITTSVKKSFDNKEVIFNTDAPNTFLIPISLILFSAIYAARPNNPKHDIRIVNPANNPVNI